MKSQVIFLNIWGHRNPDDVHDFLLRYAETTDVFCLTEVTDIAERDVRTANTSLCYGNRPEENPQHLNGYHQLSQLLGESFNIVYDSPTRANWTCNKTGKEFSSVGFGSALLTRRKLDVVTRGADIICGEVEGIQPRVLQWVVYDKGDARYLVAHMHGIWIKENTKGDHPVRLQQSQMVRYVLERIKCEYGARKIIFGGDLNLDIDTQALRVLEMCEALSPERLHNLITKFDIEGTRTPAYRKYNQSGESMFADYVLVSEHVIVEKLEVRDREPASDHAPLIVEFY